MQQNTLNLLTSYVEALRPIIYIKHFDFTFIDSAIKDIGRNKKIFEFDNAFGIVDFKDKHPLGKECDLEGFLKETWEEGFEENGSQKETFFILKNVHNQLKNPSVISLLTRIAENQLNKDDYNATVFIISDILDIPKEIENYITIFDIPLPTDREIVDIINAYIKDLNVKVDQSVINEISISFKGLNEFQIKQILNLAYQNGGHIDSKDKDLILKEKEQLIKKSGLLEIVNFRETIDDIGGLENLKIWLKQKAKIFSNLNDAINFGVDIPKGIMIIGMPGCGKSLTAKATAALFKIPLVRLDVGRLLGKYVGESENNMRNALQLSEAVSPCVLWIDEIEKAFAGVSSDGGNEVTTRLFGQFLTWMQEKENTVFIVATANNINKIPPEFMRKGRFDELFFVDLPAPEERKKIFEIHLKKRVNKIDSVKCDCREILSDAQLTKNTEGYNGADIESVVKETIELAFLEGRAVITSNDLLSTIKTTKSITDTVGKQITEIRTELQKYDIKSAH